MCRRTIAMLAACALALSASACGSTSSGATTPRPPAPVDLSVYISNSAVSVSPASVGAGPVAFTVTNQADQTESLQIVQGGAAAGQSLANTGPINPQATAQVTVNFAQPGTFTVSTADGGSIKPATIHVGKERSGSDNQLLQP
jgi:hypothetical protein